MGGATLLAIVRVSKGNRIRCQAPGCNQPAYMRIHVVEHDGKLGLYGSDCYARLFGSGPVVNLSARHGPSTGRKLTDEERELLVTNTARLLEQFEAEHAAAVESIARRTAQPIGRPAAVKQFALKPADRKPVSPTYSAMQRAAADKSARDLLEQRFPGIDLGMPGWRGLLEQEIQAILRGGR